MRIQYLGALVVTVLVAACTEPPQGAYQPGPTASSGTEFRVSREPLCAHPVDLGVVTGPDGHKYHHMHCGDTDVSVHAEARAVGASGADIQRLINEAIAKRLSVTASASAEAASVEPTGHYWLAARSDVDRTDLTKAQFADRIASGQGLTVSADAYAKLAGEILHRPFVGAGEMAEWLRSDEVQAVPCSAELLAPFDNMRVDGKTHEVGFYHRAECYKGEWMFVWTKAGAKPVPFAMGGCLNLIRPRGQGVAAAASASATVTTY